MSDAVNHASDVTFNELLTCSNVVLKRDQFRNAYFGYLNNFNNKKKYWPNNASSIEFIKNFQTNTPGYPPIKAKASLFSGATNCN